MGGWVGAIELVYTCGFTLKLYSSNFELYGVIYELV
jgi:hypothetical protein